MCSFLFASHDFNDLHTSFHTSYVLLDQTNCFHTSHFEFLKLPFEQKIQKYNFFLKNLKIYILGGLKNHPFCFTYCFNIYFPLIPW